MHGMASPTSTDQKQNVSDSPLPNLPPELRNRIYSSALASSSDISIPATSKLANPPLLQVCRQIKAECTQLYYAENEFRIVITDRVFVGPRE